MSNNKIIGKTKIIVFKYSKNYKRMVKINGEGSYVPYDPYMYNLIKGAFDEHNSEIECKSKGFFSKLFRRK